MDWNSGFSSALYATIVDKETWADSRRVEISGGNISRTEGDLRESADIECTERIGEEYVRIYLVASQGGGSVRVPVFTGLVCEPSEKWIGSHISREIQCYSVLKPASDVLLERGWYTPIMVGGGEIIKSIFSGYPAPVIVDDDSPILTAHIIAEDGETKLSMVDKILAAINWSMVILGDGTIRISPKSSEPVAKYGLFDADVIEPEVTVTNDWYSCPNVFRAISGDLVAIARDDDPSSPLSTVRRGREIWQEESNCDLAEFETIADYALRRLSELQTVAITVDYDRRYHPDVIVGSTVRIHYPEQGIDGLYRVTSQSIDIAGSCRTSESVVKIQ